jgi:hypothetical protein
VYFDRTVPALVGAMEASRTRLRASILAGLQRPASEYPLQQAWTDVQAYEAAGSLDAAIQALTDDAADRVDQANEFAAGVQTYTGAPEEGVRAVRLRMTARLRRLRNDPNGAATLRQIATGLSLQPAPDADAAALYELIIAKLETDDTTAGTQAFEAIVGTDSGSN